VGRPDREHAVIREQYENNRVPAPLRPRRLRHGRTLNPRRCPDARSLTASLRAALDRSLEDDYRVAELLAKHLIEEAIRGDFRAFKIILDRTEGKAPDRLSAD
jgi:hypothetical protein